MSDVRQKLEAAIERLGNELPSSISPTTIQMIQEVADITDSEFSDDAMRILTTFYPDYGGANAGDALKMLEKFVERKNPMAMLELGKILRGSESSSYLARFGALAQQDRARSFELIKTAQKIGSGWFDYTHYATMGFAYREEKIRIDNGEIAGEKTGGAKWLEYVESDLACMEKGLKWINDNMGGQYEQAELRAQFEYQIEVCKDLLAAHQKLK